MGLAEDLKALQDLREKGELTESAYASARDAAIRKHGSAPSSSLRFGRFVGVRLFPLLVIGLVLFAIWFFLRANYGSRQTNRAIATIVRAPVTLIDEVQNVPAASWKAVGFNLPYAGTVDVSLDVVRGNPLDVFVTTTDQLDAMNKSEWNNVRAYTDFSATKSKTYRRTGQLPQGAYYLVLRDTSLGILSSSASDISVKIQLNP
ncbi:MAG: hypothetical protein WB949_05865 [Candidatus Acidiferrales bacterium]